ncbi:ComEC/Rec2 family competence protein [Calothrix sp. UHCC 0171]|uniref:ComEC/Rec2 family competence protein n=1 Tax=Calothrix sp. UHCC 0171 TaxID=3110245 RepID=UPI002B20F954|nr:ComEC/Rec2 family competence protein [Calothrix sp. UHCC 0171]MEA5570534.1 ComEC/Rec2 family competence protein [Calothrix sp. UHCC 0171]
MIQASGVIICLGYILGLLFSAIPGGGFWIFGLGLIGVILFRRGRNHSRTIPPSKTRGLEKSRHVPSLPRVYPHPRIWLIAGLLGLLASFYLQYRVPQPTTNDVSKSVPPGNNSNQEQLFVVRGTVTSTPRLTRTSKGQFWMEAKQLDEVKNADGGGGKGVSGKLYVTLPLLQATGLYPGQQIAVTGVLYKPKAAANPGAFDFREYLQKEGVFAGLSGRQVNILNEDKKWGWWKFREQIVKSQVSFLGVPEGPLVSAMVLGSKAVDLPYDIRDGFVQVGLAHALAASGFQTSLILGIVLGLTKRATRKTQFTVGCLALLTFLCLTGFQPAVLRAVVMGFAALIALLLGKKVRQLGSLLVAATLLLIFNPLWIWDLGFQLSFLATLGLIVTVPAITTRLGWLPPTIASLISVPLAATIWTLPLQLHVFGVVPSYSLVLNIASTPLISVISIGGFISAIASLIVPGIGSAIAGILHYPTDWLLRLVDFFSNLRGNSFAVGSITVTQMFIIYIILILIWLVRWWQRRWWIGLGIALTLVLIPAWHQANTLFRVTMLAASSEPVLVIQDQGKVTLINSGDEGTGRFTILPFLQQQGVNQIDWAVASDFQGNGSRGWLELLPKLPVKVFYDYAARADNVLTSGVIQKQLQQNQATYQILSVGQSINIGSAILQLVNEQLPILQMRIHDKDWLFVGNLKPTELRQLIKAGNLPRPQVLWCQPRSLKELVPLLQPEVTITTSADIEPNIVSALGDVKTQLLFTGKDGAIQWTPNGQFEAFIQAMENKSSVF